MILRCCIVPSHAVMMIISWRVSCNDAECDHYSDAPTPTLVSPQMQLFTRNESSSSAPFSHHCHAAQPSVTKMVPSAWPSVKSWSRLRSLRLRWERETGRQYLDHYLLLTALKLDLAPLYPPLKLLSLWLGRV